MTLDEMQANTAAMVASVFERDRQLLVFLDELGLRPGAQFQVEARNYDDTLTLRLNGKPIQLGVSAAARVWVKPQPV
jgi:DtxR family transcriptional regulator, Mn-dependent transcriptional regulator